MSGLCAAVGCNNRSVGQSESEHKLSFHRFPLKNPALLKQWLINMKRKGFMPTEHHILCSEHFADNCFDTGLKVSSMWAAKYQPTGMGPQCEQVHHLLLPTRQASKSTSSSVLSSLLLLTFGCSSAAYSGSN